MGHADLGDGDGVMVIPAHLADEIADECVGMESYEDFVLEQVNAGAGIIGLYPATDEENIAKYNIWREQKGR